MIKNKKQFSKLIAILFSVCLFFGLTVFLVDFVLGDGDGIIEKLHLNSLSIFVFSCIVFVPILFLLSRISFFSNLGLVLFFSLLTLLVVEFVLRLLPAQIKTSYINTSGKPTFSRYDTVYFKNYLPNTSFKTQMAEVDGSNIIQNNINSLAIRGPEIKPKKNKRIVLVGDSFIQSARVNYEHTIGQQLSTLLGDSIDVVQHGNPSWSPLLEMNWLIKTGIQLNPDEVILFLFYNDLYKGTSVGDENYSKYCIFDDEKLPVKFNFDQPNTSKKPPIIEGFYNSLYEFRLTNFIKWKIKLGQLYTPFEKEEFNRVLTINAEEFEAIEAKSNDSNLALQTKIWGLISVMRPLEKWDGTTRKRVDLTGSYLKTLNNFLSKKGISFKICLIPQSWQFKDENKVTKQIFLNIDLTFPRGGLETYVQDLCLKENIPFLPLYDSFSDYKKQNEELLYYPLDGHWTKSGHQLAAKTIAKKLQEIK